MLALQDLLGGLLQADPARRPTVHGVMRAGVVQDAFRLAAALPHWCLLPAAGAPAQLAAPAAAKQQRAAAAPAAAAQQQQASGPAEGVDAEAVRHFLLLLRKSKQQEAAHAAAQLAALDADLADVSVERLRSAEEPAAMQQDGAAPAPKRQRLAEDSAAEAEAAGDAAGAPPAERRQRLAEVMPCLEEVYFQRRQLAARQAQQAQQGAAAAGTSGGSAHLEPFARDLSELAARSKLGLKATLRSGDIASPVEMVRPCLVWAPWGGLGLVVGSGTPAAAAPAPAQLACGWRPTPCRPPRLPAGLLRRL